jgi:hypothetical protein
MYARDPVSKKIEEAIKRLEALAKLNKVLGLSTDVPFK